MLPQYIELHFSTLDPLFVQTTVQLFIKLFTKVLLKTAIVWLTVLHILVLRSHPKWYISRVALAYAV